MVRELRGCKETEESIRDGIQKAKAYYLRFESEFSDGLSQLSRVDFEKLASQPREKVQGVSYAARSLEAALWSLLHTQDYRSCVLAAVNLGEDTGTTAAAAGGLAGLRYGLKSIPAEWLAVIAKREKIEALCGQFSDSLKEGGQQCGST